MDGTTFVTQLAQFSELEQNLAVRQDMDWISQKFTGLSSLNPEGDTTSGTDGTDTTDSSSAAANGATAPVNTAAANGTSGNAAPGKTEDTGSGSNNPSTTPTTAKS
jgi:flagellar hook assembly protein FlgD